MKLARVRGTDVSTIKHPAYEGRTILLCQPLTPDGRDKGDQVVTLYGKASIMDSPMATQQVWDRIIEIGEPYFMSTMGETSSTELVAIETIVERIELLSPRHGIFDPMSLPVG